MEIFVFCPRRSQGVLELTRELGATRLRHFDGIDFWDKRHRMCPNDGDIILNFGGELPAIDGLRIVNPSEGDESRYHDLGKLTYNIGSCLRAFPADYADEPNVGEPVYLRRRYRRIGGHDLLVKQDKWDYCTIREDFAVEYRLHVVGDKVIRAGEKVVREGFTTVNHVKDWKPDSGLVHPWVRIYEAGWTVLYDNVKPIETVRKTATQALKTLNLTFGSVDIGMAEGQPKVIKVNRCPIMDETTISAYVRAIHLWIEEKANEGVANQGALAAAIAGGAGQAYL